MIAISQKRRRQRGNTIVESAIIFPTFFVLIMGDDVDFLAGACTRTIFVPTPLKMPRAGRA